MISAENKSSKNIFGLVAVVMVVLVAFIFVVWTLRKKGYCGGNTGSGTHQSVPTDVPADSPQQEPSQPPAPDNPPPRPSNPTFLRTASIPTYSECVDGSDRVEAENNYVSLPTEEQSPPSYTDELPGVAPPTYEEVQEHEHLYNMQTAI